MSDARRLRILTDAEIAQLLAYEGQHKAFAAELRDMMLLSLDTGVRSGELIRLRREDVDTERGTLRILLGSDFGLTKSGRTRIVHAGYLFPEARDVLRRHARGDSPYLFPGRDGGVRDGTALGRAMNRIAETLGLNSGVTDPRNRVVWHTLRHTFATRMLESGVDIYTLKELLGHSSVAVTEGYLHLCDRPSAKRRWPGSRWSVRSHLGDINDPYALVFEIGDERFAGIVDLLPDELPLAGASAELVVVGKRLGGSTRPR